jgi:hypothetical protein
MTVTAQLAKKTGADPGAGAEFIITVPTGKIWTLALVTVVNVQAGSGSSHPFLVVDDGTDPFGEFPGSSAAQGVSTTCRYSWYPGAVTSGQIGVTTGVHSVGALPDVLVLPGGYRIRSVTMGLSASTDYGVPLLWVIEN